MSQAEEAIKAALRRRRLPDDRDTVLAVMGRIPVGIEHVDYEKLIDELYAPRRVVDVPQYQPPPLTPELARHRDLVQRIEKLEQEVERLKFQLQQESGIETVN